MKDLKDSKLILNESKLFPWSSKISLVPFRTFRGPLFPKKVTGQELFLAVSYSESVLVPVCTTYIKAETDIRYQLHYQQEYQVNFYIFERESPIQMVV